MLGGASSYMRARPIERKHFVWALFNNIMDMIMYWESHILKREEIHDELEEKRIKDPRVVTEADVDALVVKRRVAKMMLGSWNQIKARVEEHYAIEFRGSEGHRVALPDGRWKMKVPKIEWAGDYA